MKNTKNIIIATLSIVVILFSIYEISNIYSKSNLETDESDNQKKELDIYAAGYKTDDNNGMRTEITKRTGDFYCKTSHYYNEKTKEDQIGYYSCGKINGSTVITSSDSIDCALVLSTDTPKGLDQNLDICFELKENINKEVYKKFSLNSSDRLNINFIKGNMLGDVFKIGVSINCKDNPTKDTKIDDENIGCAGIEFAVKNKIGEWVLVGGNDECKEEKYICNSIESLIKQK